MIKRPGYIAQAKEALRRSPVTALLGPRQCGKTTLARLMMRGRSHVHTFDMESPSDRGRLQNPEMVLGALEGTVIIDEIQLMPELLAVIRVLVDRPRSKTRFLILGSASPSLARGASETLAGRLEFVDMSGFDVTEVGAKNMQTLWVRGGFPRSYLADSDKDSAAWREGFIRTFLQRDLPQFGMSIPAPAMRRFWTMLAHYHANRWNASEIARSMGLTDKTVRSYLDLLTETYMIRQLQPWHENVAKRQVKAPKVIFRDTGLLHSLLALPDHDALLGHPSVGASWEGFVLEQILVTSGANEAYHWATHQGAELDLLLLPRGKRLGVEVKFSESPSVTKSMRIALEDLSLERLLVVCPVPKGYPIAEGIDVCALGEAVREVAKAHA